MKNISLVLGSGGARGLAHIGVLHWLEENDYTIASISGCSIGALVGGIYATGKLDEFEQWVRSIGKFDIMRLLDISWSKSGLVKGEKIINTLTQLTGDVLIEDLPLKFTAVTTDFVAEKEVWINSGSLFSAIRASISLPLFFTPHKRNNIQLIDGGVLNPVPIAPTFSDNTDMTIAVNLGGTVEQNFEHPKKQEVEPDSFSEAIEEKISSFFNKLQKIGKESSPLDRDVYDIANQAFDAMQSTIARQKLAAYPPDITVEIPRNICGIMEFDRADELIQLGYQRMDKALKNKEH